MSHFCEGMSTKDEQQSQDESVQHLAHARSIAHVRIMAQRHLTMESLLNSRACCKFLIMWSVVSTLASMFSIYYAIDMHNSIILHQELRDLNVKMEGVVNHDFVGKHNRRARVWHRHANVYNLVRANKRTKNRSKYHHHERTVNETGPIDYGNTDGKITTVDKLTLQDDGYNLGDTHLIRIPSKLDPNLKKFQQKSHNEQNSNQNNKMVTSTITQQTQNGDVNLKPSKTLTNNDEPESNSLNHQLNSSDEDNTDHGTPQDKTNTGDVNPRPIKTKSNHSFNIYQEKKAWKGRKATNKMPEEKTKQKLEVILDELVEVLEDKLLGGNEDLKNDELVI